MKTENNDTTSSTAQKLDSSFSENRISNTREVFVCLLRAFNCAHDLILENKGMLTTLTVAIVLPLKQNKTNLSDQYPTYICCVCNVGDTLAYVYSPKTGVREITKGSHDINCNRDMRDALGALGPVEGIKPELSNLTLSLTTLYKGDIVLIASDGLTDNFDPNVCKFTVSLSDGDFNKTKRQVSTSKREYKDLRQKDVKTNTVGVKKSIAQEVGKLEIISFLQFKKKNNFYSAIAPSTRKTETSGKTTEAFKKSRQHKPQLFRAKRFQRKIIF